MKSSFPKVLQVLISCLLVSYLLSRLQWENILEFKEALLSPLFLIAPLISLIGLGAAALRWKILVKNFHFQRPYIFFYRNYCLGSFFNILLPSSIGGDVLRIRSTHKEGLSLKASSFVVFMERVSGLISIFFLGSFFSLFVHNPRKLDLGPQLLYPTYLFTFIFFLTLFFLATLSRKPSWQQVLLKTVPKLRVLIGDSKRLKSLNFKKLLPPLALSALFQSSEVLVSVLIAHILGIELYPSTLFIIFPAVFIATALPLSLGGLGMREGTMAHLLSLFGVSFEQSILLAFLIHINRVLVALMGGLIYSTSKKKSEEISPRKVTSPIS